MKRKTLTTAVLAGLTGVAGMVSVSNAVNINPDGLGQVLLYPYYSARGSNDTLFSIVNTTDNAKSVKVRFLEALNSREVLDFNLYMSAFDVWVAAITATEDGGGQILVPDSSCTVPYFFGNDTLEADEDETDRLGQQDFLTFGYADDGGPQDIERTASGYIEVIEMGTLVDLTNGSATAATHGLTTFPDVGDISRPADCAQLVEAWTSVGANDGYWIVDQDIDHEPPSGGLFGGASIINVPEGTMFSYTADAIDGFVAGRILHTDPGSIFPNLNSGDETSNVFIGGIVDTRTWADPVEAVSATVLYNTVMNEYVVSPENAQGNRFAKSEWVVNFPTKRFYVDTPFAIDTPPVAPFTSVWSADGACEVVDFQFWDREEAPSRPPITGPIVSPPPPDGPGPDDFELCFEANVIRFADGGDQPDATEILAEPRFTTLPVLDAGYTDGWVRFSFENVTRPGDDGAGNLVEYIGLPTIGFWVNTFSNGNAGGAGVLANYGGTFKHRGSRDLQAFVPPTP